MNDCSKRTTVTRWLAAALLGLALATPAAAAALPKPRILTRVFIQDDESRTVKWGDLTSGEKPNWEGSAS